MINFHIPGLLNHVNINIALIKLIKEHSEYFYDNINISGIYGSFPPNIWNGGRVELSLCPKETKEKIINTFNELGVACIFTYTNTKLEDRMFNDMYCNEDLQLGSHYENKIIINEPKLIDYIKSKHPNYKFISSITNVDSKNIKVINEKLNSSEWDKCVVNQNYNNTDALFELDHKEKIEILLNSQCKKFCPYEKEHYDNISEVQIGKAIKTFTCPYKLNEKNKLDDLMTLDTFITVEDLYNKYVPVGFNLFKINGRLIEEQDIIDYYLYYLVKEEFKETVKECLNEANKNPFN